MNRILLSLFALGLTARAATETTIVFDIASDCRTFNYSPGIPLAQVMRGDAFIMEWQNIPRRQS